MRTKKQKPTAGRVIRRWIILILTILVLLFLVLRLTGKRITVTGNAMAPTLAQGDVLIVDTLTYRLTDPGRYDVVVFKPRFAEDKVYIRRIIGKPGETVRIVDGDIYINGALLNEKYNFGKTEAAGRAYDTITLGADEYFVLGDNRSAGDDSREPAIGNVPRAEIQGKVLLRNWPLTSIGMIH